jgi:hypothetical protein
MIGALIVFAIALLWTGGRRLISVVRHEMAYRDWQESETRLQKYLR